MTLKHLSLIALALSLLRPAQAETETLPPLVDSKAPQTYDALWAGYDPRREPLDIEVLKQWEEDGVILKVLRYRIGIFKGQKAMMAAVYGCPKGGTRLPGLVQIHGGGQFANYHAPLTNAKRGYATISIAWAGRISAPGYEVNSDVVKLFWEGKTTDPKYKVTTDWGPLDAYHAPCRNPKNEFANVNAAAWTLDAVESPRNNPWFLCTLGARRALTFLEQQPEVDPTKLGVYGHSMGGKLTVLTTAADSRVKASAPSCGGLSDRNSENALYRATVSDETSLQRIACPIIFLSPANDFHGRIDDLQTALQEIRSPEWRVTCSAHHNHQDTEPYQVAGLLWFDQYLKGAFQFPKTPDSKLELTTADGVPSFTVQPDTSRTIVSVDIYYTQQGQPDPKADARENTIARFWHHARAERRGDAWTAPLPVLTTLKPLWAYANVLYALDQPVTGAGYYYGVYTAKQVNLSSRMAIATTEALARAGVKPTLQPSRGIESFEADWQKEWFSYDLSGSWARKTHKLYDPQWAPPPGARLGLAVRSEKSNKLVLGLDGASAEVKLTGGGEWQRLVLDAADFHNGEGTSLTNWSGIREFRLEPKATLRSKDGEKSVALGAEWQGPAPEFQKLEWVVP